MGTSALEASGQIDGALLNASLALIEGFSPVGRFDDLCSILFKYTDYILFSASGEGAQRKEGCDKLLHIFNLINDKVYQKHLIL